ncbi:MAG TPA: hypothetical protein V6C81_17195 [Planktothrix sp.]|jgi:hypothetical protein
MTTATLNKTKVEQKWDTHKIQEEIARLMGVQYLTTMNVLQKVGGEKAVHEFQAAMRQNKVEHYKKLGANTPVELVKLMSEFEANVFGSKIEIWGDEKSASLKYDSCAMWNAMKKHGNFNAQQEEQMGKGFESCMTDLAKEFGFHAETKMEGETAIITFTK